MMLPEEKVVTSGDAHLPGQPLPPKVNAAETNNGADDEVEEHLFSSRHLSTLMDLSIGAPGPDILCQLPPLFERITQHRMAREAVSGGDLFQYGPEAGLLALRRRLATFLSARYGGDAEAAVDPESLVVTGGATGGLVLVGTLLLQPGATVFVEDPTYFIALDILAKDLSFRIQPVPMTKDGVDTEALEQAILAAKPPAAGEDGTDRYWGMFYTIPTFHNPTGITMSLSTCHRVVDLAARHGLLVMCDDVYNLLRYENEDKGTALQPPSRLKAIDKHGVVISNGTFSKILSPGIRLGWLELPLALVPRFTGSGVLLSAGCLNNYMSGLLSSLLQLNLLDGHIDVLVQLYRERMSLAQGYLSAHLPAGWQVTKICKKG